MGQPIPYRRVVVEGLVIIVSILLAFGIEASWGERQERIQRGALMEDLESEIVSNITSLEDALVLQRLRVERIEIILNELTPEASGVSRDSLVTLQAAVLVNPSYDASWGILDLLIQSGDLALLENRDLRAKLAGIKARANDYLSNQDWILQRQAVPEVLYGTGSLVMDYSAVIPGDQVITEADPAARDTAAKFWTAIHTVLTRLVIGQGEELLAELQDIRGLSPD